jgi:hypothetical protein
MISTETAIQEKPVSVSKACKLFDTNPSLQTLLRWHDVGVLAWDRKTRVRLRMTLIGGRKFVYPSAVTEFLAALNDPRLATTQLKPGEASKPLEALGC